MMEQFKKTSSTLRPEAGTAANVEPAPKTWTTPELVKMDVVDSTRAGGVARALPESPSYRPIS